jgi:hypothetical protein
MFGEDQEILETAENQYWWCSSSNNNANANNNILLSKTIDADASIMIGASPEMGRIWPNSSSWYLTIFKAPSRTRTQTIALLEC